MTSIYKKCLLALCLALMLFTCSLNVFALPSQDYEAEARFVYFDYDDGIVRDGARHDRDGIIGDEFDYYLDGEYARGRNLDSAEERARAEEQSNAVTFFGIAASLVVIAAVILLIALVTPKASGERERMERRDR